MTTVGTRQCHIFNHAETASGMECIVTAHIVEE
jgi:hypothetical protein